MLVNRNGRNGEMVKKIAYALRCLLKFNKRSPYHRPRHQSSAAGSGAQTVATSGEPVQPSIGAWFDVNGLLDEVDVRGQQLD
ncbi:hypothetical protein HPP92_015534 [Vanilla planifolia]|uniref:Uncharacterized protein n=1 Tax=Vanilla planifolia TaxID=51239 RepID=A0A835QLV6_VANPL|nr:hypothetical protein HPP92_015534 [Vanilla planifolia]